MIVTAPPPAVAMLLVIDPMVCVTSPVMPRSQSPQRMPPLLPTVSVLPLVAVLVAVGLRLMDVDPPLFELSALGATVTVLSVTVPEPRALFLDSAKASPPSVLFLVVDVAEAVAGPLEPLLASPVLASAVEFPPTAVPLVVEVALAGDPLIIPVPVADMPALTVVSPTAAVLDCVEGAEMVTLPPPAAAALLTVGLTVWVTFPVLPWSQSRTRKQPVLARVVTLPLVAVLVAVGLSLTIRSPPLFELVALGWTVIVLLDTEPFPDAWFFEIAVASPPSV